MVNQAKEYAKDQFAKFVMKGGKRVSKEHGDARIFEACKNGSEEKENWCEFYGLVEPLPDVKVMGCTKCGCPEITKPYMDTFYRIKDDDRPLTPTELFMIRVGKALNLPLNEVKMICKHPDGNRWEPIDEKFK